MALKPGFCVMTPLVSNGSEFTSNVTFVFSVMADSESVARKRRAIRL